MNFKFKLSRRLAGMKSALLLMGALGACSNSQPTSIVSAVPSNPTVPSNAPIASVTVTPASGSVASGANQQLVALAKDAQGKPISATFTWTSSDENVASVSAAGVVNGKAAGSAKVIAASGGYADTAEIAVTAASQPQPPGPVTHSGYHVSPSGSSGGEGSAASPWSLAAALSGAGGRIQAGDTVWMHGGTYTGNYLSTLAGVAGRPVVFRQYPGERATIDGTLRADGPDVAFWGFEIMRSTPNDRLPALEARGARQQFINLVIHDAAQQGITFWDEAIDAVVYGCIVYNNGTHENLDHGTYVHNMSGTKLIKDNVFFNNLAYGIHVYAGPTEGVQRNVHVIGNVVFDNGTISQTYAAKGNIIIGDEAGDEGMQAKDNLLYFAGTAGENLRLGYTAANRDVVATGNTVYGGLTALVMGQWSSATVQNNTFGGPVNMVTMLAVPGSYSWSGNRYYRDASASAWGTATGSLLSLSLWQSATGLGAGDQTTTPSTTQVFVRPNDYEGGRALVAVYNFGHQGSVSVDLSGIGLGVGARYEVRNVQDMFGAPVASGTYAGGSITLPMTGVPAPTPIGRSTGQAPRTGPIFDTFVVIPL